ncbi:MAG: class I SAM-dependent methyltransferase [Acidobacteriota bacterium]
MTRPPQPTHDADAASCRPAPATVPGLEEQLRLVAEAFSRKADAYDELDRISPSVKHLREKVRARVTASVPAGGRILELNAGTGSDALALVRSGFRVHATEIAPGMLSAIRSKVQRYGVGDRLTVQELSFTRLERLEGQLFDAVLSNTGGLNCISDLSPVCRQLPRLLVPGAAVIWVIMPRLCPWELAQIFRDPRVALRRLTPGGTWANVEGVRIRTTYHSARRVRQALGSAFQLTHLESLLLLTPPADNVTFAERHPRLYHLLVAVEERICRLPPFRGWGDFFLAEFRYRP